MRLPYAIAWWQRIQPVVWGMIFIIGASLVLLVPIPLGQQVALSVGDVSPTDIRSPRQITYESQVLTEQARNQAAAAVLDVYDPPATRVRREQVARAREILDFIESVRHDDYASTDQQIAWINAIPDITLLPPTVEQLLTLDEESWRRVSNEVPTVLDRIMREEIREGQLQLYQRRVSGLVSLDLTDEESVVVTGLVRALMRPNSFFNAERTQTEREAARNRVPPQMRTLEAGEIILRTGDLVRAEDVEALKALGLQQARPSRLEILRTVLFVLLVSALMGAYLYRLMPELGKEQRWPLLLVIVMLSFLVLARVLISGHTVPPFIFPMAAMAMLLAALLDIRLSILATVSLTLFAGYMNDGSLELMTYLLVGSLVGAFVLGRGERLGAFVRSGILITLTNMAVLLVFNLPSDLTNTVGLIQLLAVAVVNGGLSASLTLISFFLLGSIFGITTSLQLMELSRPTHPLLRQLLLKAPGTYHHTILVSNLGERAAEAVGADPLLTRVGAYYHDIGKTLRPYFFVDNQTDGVNPHDRLDPHTSAQIIISHVKDGLEMARRYRLPLRLQDFIPEHHGTTLVSFFYHKALEQAGKDETVDESLFRYPGPRPRSKETAIIMLADGCESAVRATRPGSRKEIDSIVRKLINARLADGELDESDLTLRDLDHIRQAFVKTLQGIHHPRIQYPEPARAVDETGVPLDAERAAPMPVLVERPISVAAEPTEPVRRTDRQTGGIETEWPSRADANGSPGSGVG